MAAPAPTTFDTLSAARELEAAGIERGHAEAIAGTVRKATAAEREALATKGDLAEFRAGMRADLAELRAATKADIAEVKADVKALRWVLGFVAAAQLATVAKLFGIV